MKPRPSILVTDAGRGSSLAIIRSLGRCGWRVIAADSSSASGGFASRYVSERWVYPDPAQNASDFVAAVAEYTRREPVDLIIPVTDKVIFPLAEARDLFADRCALAIPHDEALHWAANKAATWELAQELGVPTPRTYRAAAGQAIDAAELNLGWPVVVKPRSSQVRRGVRSEALHVSYAESPAALARTLDTLDGRCDVLLQEYVGGIGCGVELLLDRGHPVLAFQHERLREVPVYGGASALRKSVPLDPTLLDYSVRLLSHMKWHGLAMVEFKLGAHGPRLMEVNGRVWGSLPLAVRCGVDFPVALANLYLQPPGAQEIVLKSYPTDMRARNLRLDLLWIAAVLRQRNAHPFLAAPRRYRALQALAQLANPWIATDSFQWTDPWPLLHEIRGLWQKASSKSMPITEAVPHVSTP